MHKLNYHDAVQLFQGALMLRKGKLCKIREIVEQGGGDMKIRIFDLKSQRSSLVDFEELEYKTPSKRFGYINMNNNAAYVTRAPHRVYTIGLHAVNMDIRFPEGAAFNESMYTWKDTIRQLENPAIISAYNNEYPSFLEAVANAKAWGSSCAFDKQFAVSSEGWIFYKHRKVGTVVDMKPQFNPSYQYLQTLLDGNHEKTSGTFRSTPL